MFDVDPTSNLRQTMFFIGCRKNVEKKSIEKLKLNLRQTMFFIGCRKNVEKALKN